jgi:hypothetical protein
MSTVHLASFQASIAKQMRTAHFITQQVLVTHTDVSGHRISPMGRDQCGPLHQANNELCTLTFQLILYYIVEYYEH